MPKAKVAALKLRPGNRARRHRAAVRARRICRSALDPRADDDPQGQHLLALPVSRRQHHALAAGGDDPRAQQRRFLGAQLRAEQDRGHQRLQGRGPEPLRPDLQAATTSPSSTTSSDEDMRWVEYRPKAQACTSSTSIFPDGIKIPDYFFGKNIVHLPTVKCHIYTTTTGAMKNAFGGLLSHPAPLHALLDPPHAGRPAGDPEGDPQRPVRGHGRHHRRQRPRAAHHVPGDQGLHAGVGRSGGHRRRRRQDDGLRSDEPRVHPRRARGRARRGRPARHRGGRRRHLRRELGLLGRRQRRQQGRRRDVVRPAEALPEAVLPHPAGQRLHLRQRGLSRLLPLADARTGRCSRTGSRPRAWGQLFAAYERGESDRVLHGLASAHASAE